MLTGMIIFFVGSKNVIKLIVTRLYNSANA